MEVIVRKASLGDEASIARVHVAAWQAAYTEFMGSEFLNSLSIDQRKEMWENALKQPGGGKYLVAEVQNHIQGFAVFGPARDSDLDKSSSELVALNVHPEFWRQNLGTSLLKRVLESVSKESYKSLHLWVIKGNTPAIKLYERFGFEYSGRSKTDSNHSGNPLHELRYSKSLVG
ncbi:GNAT family N-acetyltransferase [Thiosocius teredinicola]|uniref:GNAT family N-acetyltransferase n=1 Tax=Thiosocius teredinicola TaxID=1973002 RepID=UPI0013DE37F0